MADRNPSETRRDEQYRRMVEALGSEFGRSHGWKKRVAARLGITQSHLSKILSGERRAGPGLARRAADRLGFNPRYFETAEAFERYRHGGPVSLDRLRERASHLLEKAQRGHIPTELDCQGLARAVENLDFNRKARAVLYALDHEPDTAVAQTLELATRLVASKKGI